MSEATETEPSELRRIARALPRRRVALVLAIVVVNLAVMTIYRGITIACDRHVEGVRTCYITCHCPAIIPPWHWSADEWRRTSARGESSNPKSEWDTPYAIREWKARLSMAPVVLVSAVGVALSLWTSRRMWKRRHEPWK